MTDDDRALLEEVVVLARDNRRMLRAMRRWQWYGLGFKLALLTSAIVIPLYVYQAFFAPLLPTFLDMGNLLESYQAGQ